MRSIRPIEIAQALTFVRMDQGGSLIRLLTLDGFSFVKKSLRGRRVFEASLITKNIDEILRLVRGVVGLAILLTILTAIVIPQVLPVTGNSFVNAKLEWIRTPIEGDLDFVEIKAGDKIDKGMVLGAVTNQRADDLLLSQLNSEKLNLESVLLTLEKRREHLKVRQHDLSVRVADSLKGLQYKTRIQLELIENEIFSAAEELDSISERLDRYRKANSDYDGDVSFAVVSRSRIESLADRKMELQIFLAGQRKSMSLMQSKLDSVVSGSFISEDTPLEQQQLIDVDHSLASVELELSSVQLKSDRLSAQIESRKQLLTKNTRYELVSGVSGTVWDIGFPNGSYVNRGDSVVAIADTDTVSVEGNFHQRYLDNINIGDPATIDLMGSRQRISGTVTEIKIRDQVKSADLSAFNLSNPESNEFKVVVSFDGDQSKDVYIGQRARLIISKSRSSRIPSLLLFFNR